MKQFEPDSAACEEFRKQLPFYMYGELEAEAELGLEQHLSECAACQAESVQWRRTFDVLDSSELELPSALLVECRRDLRDALTTSAAPAGSLFRRAGQWLRNAWTGGMILRPVPALASAALLLGVGVAGGSLLRPSALNQEPSADSTVRVRYVAPGENGRVRLVLEETRLRDMEGFLDDDNVQAMMVRAATDSADPGVRVDSIELLNHRTHATEVRNALLTALEHDGNAGVRLKALQGLRSYTHDTGVRRVISSALLNDEDPGIRIQAIDALMQSRQPEMIGVFQESIAHEENDYIRQRTRHALQEMNASLGTF
jgi:hypothetical protein